MPELRDWGEVTLGESFSDKKKTAVCSIHNLNHTHTHFFIFCKIYLAFFANFAARGCLLTQFKYKNNSIICFLR